MRVCVRKRWPKSMDKVHICSYMWDVRQGIIVPAIRVIAWTFARSLNVWWVNHISLIDRISGWHKAISSWNPVLWALKIPNHSSAPKCSPAWKNMSLSAFVPVTEEPDGQRKVVTEVALFLLSKESTWSFVVKRVKPLAPVALCWRNPSLYWTLVPWALLLHTGTLVPETFEQLTACTRCCKRECLGSSTTRLINRCLCENTWS